MHTDKWPSGLQAILKGDVLDAYLAKPVTIPSNYEVIKTVLLLQAGVSHNDHVQRLLHFNPRHGYTTAQYFSNSKDFLTNLSSSLTKDQFIDLLSLEFTYRAIQPHIVSFVHTLHRPTPLDSIREID